MTYMSDPNQQWVPTRYSRADPRDTSADTYVPDGPDDTTDEPEPEWEINNCIRCGDMTTNGNRVCGRCIKLEHYA